MIRNNRVLSEMLWLDHACTAALSMQPSSRDFLATNWRIRFETNLERNFKFLFLSFFLSQGYRFFPFPSKFEVSKNDFKRGGGISLILRYFQNW